MEAVGQQEDRFSESLFFLPGAKALIMKLDAVYLPRMLRELNGIMGGSLSTWVVPMGRASLQSHSLISPFLWTSSPLEKRH